MGIFPPSDKYVVYLPLPREIAVACGDAKDEAVEGGHGLRIDDGKLRFARCMHLGQDFLRQRLRDSGDER